MRGSARAAPGAVEVVVTDTGIGVGAEVLPHIFDEFRQADATRPARWTAGRVGNGDEALPPSSQEGCRRGNRYDEPPCGAAAARSCCSIWRVTGATLARRKAAISSSSPRISWQTRAVSSSPRPAAAARSEV